MKFISLLYFSAFFGTVSAVQVRSGKVIERVVKLLESLKKEIVADGDAEEKIYNKYACWCEKTTAEKAEAIDTGYKDMKANARKVLLLKGTVVTKGFEVEDLKTQIKTNNEDQAKLTSVRQKENSAYQVESSEMMQAIAALQQAVAVLKKATGGASAGALLQEQASARSAVRAAILGLPSRTTLSDKQTALLTEFVNGASNAHSQFSPQSATIQGILVEMYETFAADLETATQTEAIRNADYESLMAAKASELKTMTEMVSKTEAAKASAQSELADTSATYEYTFSQKMADIKFFDATKESCMKKADEYTTRVNLRNEELEGVTQALKILSTDEARALFAKTIKPGAAFIQLSSHTSGANDDSVQSRAYDALKKQASKFHSLRLARLAARVRLSKVGHFEEVLKAIDGMMQTLKDEDAADVAKRDECKQVYQSISSTLADLSWKIEKSEAKISKLESVIELRTKDKDETVEEISALEKQIADMNDERKAANDQYLAEKKEYEAAIGLITDAIDALSAYYKKNADAMMLAQGDVKKLSFKQEPAFDISKDAAPAATFSDKATHKNPAENVEIILTMIKTDLEKEIKDADEFEEQQTASWLTQKGAAEDLLKKLVEKKTELEGMIATGEKEKTDEELLMSSNAEDKTNKVNYKNKITPDCDFIIRAFTDRATKRATEMKGLTEAKQYLAGYESSSSASFLEKKAKFNDDTLPGLTFMGIQ